MKKILNKKVLGVLLAVMMLFSLAAPAFATTGTATVKIYMPDHIFDDVEFDSYYTNHTGYSFADYGEDIMGDPVGIYYYTCPSVSLSTITTWAVTPPTGFTDLLNAPLTAATYTPSVFDVIYKAIVAKGETPSIYDPQYDDNAVSGHGFEYGVESPAYYFDPYNPSIYGRADGFFLNSISNTAEHTCYEDYSMWYGYGWHIYQVPANDTDFDPLAPDASYMLYYQDAPVYANNLAAQDGYTYYVIYEFAYEDWS